MECIGVFSFVFFEGLVFKKFFVVSDDFIVGIVVFKFDEIDWVSEFYGFYVGCWDCLCNFFSILLKNSVLFYFLYCLGGVFVWIVLVWWWGRRFVFLFCCWIILCILFLDIFWKKDFVEVGLVGFFYEGVVRCNWVFIY